MSVGSTKVSELKAMFIWPLIVFALISEALVASCSPQSVAKEPVAKEPPLIVSHRVNGEYAGDCLSCHNQGSAQLDFPPDHIGRTVEQCLTCHQTSNFYGE